MQKIGFEKWQTLQDEFLNGDLDDVEFCKSRNLDLKYFRQKLSEYDHNEKKSKDLFVELVPDSSTSNDSISSASLKFKFRDADFELSENFPVEVFRQALRVIREEL